MASRTFCWVDAFTDAPLGGNPCAVVLDADDLDAGRMQALACEMGLSETAFAMRSQRADARARYFTVHGEIPMAGHPTVATMCALADAGRLALTGECTSLVLELEAGLFPIEMLARDGEVTAVIMSQRPPRFLERPDPGAVLLAFGLEPADLVDGAPIEIVSTGTPQLFVAVSGLDALRRARVDGAAYAGLHAGGGFFSAHLFCTEGATAEGATFARHFAGPHGGIEDPFTGSATGAMAAYLWRYGLLEEPRFMAEQGHWLGRPGQAAVEVVGARDAIETVRVAGSARILVRGTIDL